MTSLHGTILGCPSDLAIAWHSDWVSVTEHMLIGEHPGIWHGHANSDNSWDQVPGHGHTHVQNLACESSAVKKGCQLASQCYKRYNGRIERGNKAPSEAAVASYNWLCRSLKFKFAVLWLTWPRKTVNPMKVTLEDLRLRYTSKTSPNSIRCALGTFHAALRERVTAARGL